MSWSYNKLWKMLIDRNMSKTTLRLQTGISTMALAHMGKNEPVTMESLGRICKVMECNIGDIVEWIPDAVDIKKE